VKQQKGPNYKDLTKEKAIGRPWTIYEGFQIILQAQAKAFVSLGVDKSLMEAVFMIWANYLSKIGVAFCEEEKVVPDIVLNSRLGRPRELYRGSIGAPEICMKRKTSNNGSVVKEKISRNDETLSVSGPNSDMSDQDDDIALSDEDEVEKGFIQEGVNKLNKKFMKVEKDPEWLTLSKVLGMVYIGVSLTSPQILPADVIRWVYDGKIPYLSTAHLFPADMMFSTYDEQTFNGEIEYSELVSEVSKLMKFFKMKAYPPDVIPSQESTPLHTVDILIIRFIRDLDLPVQLGSVCLGVVQTGGRVLLHNVFHEQLLYRRHELLAMAAIIIGLKLTFGLDDSTERILSLLSDEVQDVVGESPKIFIWSKWRLHQMHKEQNTFCAFKENKKDISASGLQNIDSISAWHSHLQRGERKPTTNKSISESGSDFMTALKRPLKEACKTLEQYHKSGESTEGNQKKENQAKDLFSKSTISHLVNFSEFRLSLNKCDSRTLDHLEEQLRQHKPKTLAAYNNESCAREKHRTQPASVISSILKEQRHEVYLWLLTLCSDHISPNHGYQESIMSLYSLDGVVNKLQKRLVSGKSHYGRKSKT